MKKSEIKAGIKSIIESVEIVRKGLEEQLSEYKKIVEHLDAIEEIERESAICTGIYFEETKGEILRNYIDDNGDVEEITNKFEELIDDLENWQEEVSESKSDKIQEDYIDILNEIKDGFEAMEVDTEEEFENSLYDVISALEEMDIINKR